MSLFLFYFFGAFRCSEAGSFLEALLLALDEEAPVGPYVPEAFRVLAPVKAWRPPTTESLHRKAFTDRSKAWRWTRPSQGECLG